MRARVVFGLLLLSCAPNAIAADLREVTVTREDGVFSLHSVVWFDAEVAAIYTVFLDYDMAEKISPYVVEGRNLEPGEDGLRRFYVRNRGCVWFFCQEFVRTGSVDHQPYDYIRVSADPELSDFEISDEAWDFSPEGDGTLVVYAIEFKPKFWLPPVIGPYMLQKKLERDSIAALDNIEVLARELEL